MTAHTPDRDLAAKIARAELMKRVLIVLTAALTVAVLIGQLQTVSAIRATQQEGSPTLRAIEAQQDDIETAAQSSAALNKLVLDCLTPGTDCYRQSQKNTADTVASVNEVTVYAVTCADRLGTQSLEQIQACVDDLLTAAR